MIPVLPAIPLPYRVLAAIAFTVAVYGLGRWHGSNATQKLWDAAKLAQAAQDAETKAKQAEATVKVVTKYVDRVQVVREKGDTIIKKVPIYVPSDSCPLPGGFRVLHDAAAANVVPDAPRHLDAPAADAQTVAAVVTENYGTCHDIREQLIALQAWVKAQMEASKR